MLPYSDLAHEYGISRQAITLRAKKECWEKTGNLVTINREAALRADGLTVVDKVDCVDKPLDLKKDAGFDAAVDKRTDVLVKHRGQIATLDEMQNSAKSLFDEAMAAKITVENAGDEQKVKTAKNLWWQCKIAADIVKDHCAATKLKHDAERKAWGLDEPTLSPEDFASMTSEELTCLAYTGKIPMRFQSCHK